MVNYEDAVKKPFTDLQKLIIGIVLSVIQIINFTIVTGFAIESSGLGKSKPSKKMPEWKDWGDLFIKGLSAFVIKIIYMIPAILVIVAGIGVLAGDVISMLLGTVMTPEIMSQITSSISSQQIGQLMGQNWYMMLPSIIRVAPIIMFGLLLALIATFLTPLAVLNYIKKRKFNAAFEFNLIFKKALTGKYVIAWLAVLILGAIMLAVLSWIPILGAAIALFVIGVIGYSLYGQVYKEV